MLPGLDELPEVHFEFLNRQIDDGFFNRPIIALESAKPGLTTEISHW